MGGRVTQSSLASIDSFVPFQSSMLNFLSELSTNLTLSYNMYNRYKDTTPFNSQCLQTFQHILKNSSSCSYSMFILYPQCHVPHALSFLLMTLNLYHAHSHLAPRCHVLVLSLSYSRPDLPEHHSVLPPYTASSPNQ